MATLTGSGVTFNALNPSRSRCAFQAVWSRNRVSGSAFSRAIVAAGRPWWLGVVFALVLEAMMVSLYPGWLRVPLTSEFVTLSVTGHLAYGSMLGAIARRVP